jgi:hypothetical protein
MKNKFSVNQTINTNNSTINGNNSKINGNGNIITGNGNIITGNNLDVRGDDNIILGNNNDVKGNNNEISGNNNDVVGKGNVMKGNNNDSVDKIVLPLVDPDKIRLLNEGRKPKRPGIVVKTETSSIPKPPSPPKSRIIKEPGLFDIFKSPKKETITSKLSSGELRAMMDHAKEKAKKKEEEDYKKTIEKLREKEKEENYKWKTGPIKLDDNQREELDNYMEKILNNI